MAATPAPPVLSSCLPPHDALPFCNTSLPEAVRLDDLIGRLTLSELVGQLFMDADLACALGKHGTAHVWPAI